MIVRDCSQFLRASRIFRKSRVIRQQVFSSPSLKSIMPAFELNKESLKTKEGWSEFYKKDFLPWQAPEFTKVLVDNVDTLLKSAKKDGLPRERVRFFVPLCGCSLDLVYLYEQGFGVVGVDLIEDSMKKMNETHGEKIKMTKKEINDDYCVYQTDDGRLSVVIGDYFKLTPAILGGKVDCIWDVNALCAMDLTWRANYAKVMSTLVNDDFAYLLRSVERENPSELSTEMPHSLTYKEAYDMFKESFSVQLIHQETTRKPKPEAEIDETDPLCRRVEKTNMFLLTKKANTRLDHWGGQWAANTPGWHMDSVNPVLQKYFNELTGGRSKLNFLFPLCGKALEMKWVYDQGHTVIGIEGIVSAAEQFFEESGIEYTKTKRTDFECWAYSSKDDNGRLTIFVCDLFDITSNVLGKSIDCTWDIGSYVAIFKEDRKKYIELLLSFNAPQFKHMMETRQYDASVYDGTPRNVEAGEIENFYKEISGDTVKVTLLESETIAPLERFNFVVMEKVNFMIESV